jgi:hypothetical protein
MIAGLLLVSFAGQADARAPGTISVEGGVDQNPDEIEHPGYRCDQKTPMRFSIEGPALIYVEVVGESGAHIKLGDVLLTFVPPAGGEKPIPLPEPEKKTKKREPTPFALDLASGLMRFNLRCHAPKPVIFRMWSVESVPKRLTQVPIPPR